jgi:glycosyltransferase involved in cell wall biosynthesis
VKIVMVMSTPMPPTEGIGNQVFNVSRRLVERGHPVTIITRGSWKAGAPFDMEGIKVFRAPFYPAYPFHVHLHGLFVNSLLRKIERPDVVHLHTPLVPPVKVAAPIITTVHTPMLMDSRYAEPVNALGVAIKLQAPVSFRLEKSLIRRSALVAAVARSVAEELISYGVRPESVVITRTGVDQNIFRPVPEQPDSERYVLTVGRLAYRKGLFDIVRCAALLGKRYPDLKFFMAGSGPLEAHLRALISKLGLEGNVRLLGPLGYQSPGLVKLYQRCAVYLQASHYEGLPTALLEAMACGRPVVATAVSGHLDAITTNENGLLVPPGCPDRLANAIDTLLQDPTLSNRLGTAARQTIEEDYTWDIVTERLLTCYRRVLNSQPEVP